jgi:hypothetical protein
MPPAGGAVRCSSVLRGVRGPMVAMVAVHPRLRGMLPARLRRRPPRSRAGQPPLVARFRAIKTHSVAARSTAPPAARRGRCSAIRCAARQSAPLSAAPEAPGHGRSGDGPPSRGADVVAWTSRGDCRRFCAGPPTPGACPEQVHARDARVSLVSAAQGEEKVRRARRALAASPQQGD